MLLSFKNKLGGVKIEYSSPITENYIYRSSEMQHR